MTMFLGYTGAIALGASITLVVMALDRRRAKVPLLAELAASSTDARTRRLAQPLPLRLVGVWGDHLVALGRRLTPGRSRARLHERLDQAGFAAPAEVFHAAKAAAGALGLVVGIAVALLLGPGGSWTLVIPLLLGLGGLFTPEIYLSHATQRRGQLVTLALPESLDLLALTVQAGLGLEQALTEVSAEVPGPLGEEFERVLKEQQLGRSRREALEALRLRTSSEDLARLVAALLHAEELGTPLSTTLRTQATELRRRRRARARERAGKAPVKLLFPLIFCILPAMFVVIIGPGILSILSAFSGR